MTDNGDYGTGTQTQEPPPAPPVPPAPAATSTPPPPGGGRGRGGGGVTAGVILILIGAALLVARFAPGYSIWQLWPLFVIVPGVVQCFTPGHEGWSVHRFFDGLVTVSIGLLFLGNTTGYISWGVWWELLQLWPVLLISVGLGILGKAVDQSWLRVLGTLVVLAAFGVAAASSLSQSPVRLFSPAAGGQAFSYEEPLTGTTGATLTMKSGVGEIDIDSVRGRRVEIEGSSPYGEPRFEVSSSGGTSDVDFSLTGEGGVSAFPGTPATLVRARLSEQVPWEIAIDSGVSTLDADLSDLDVSRFQLKTGVSSNTVRLGDAPDGVDEGTVTIEAGVSSVRVLVPSDAEVRVESASGLTGVDIPDLLERSDGRTWQTPGFDEARQSGDPVWVISAKSGIGSFSVDTY